MSGGPLRDSASAVLFRWIRGGAGRAGAAVRSSLAWGALSSARGLDGSAVEGSRLLDLRVPAPGLLFRLNRKPVYYLFLVALLVAAKWAAPVALLVFAAVDRTEDDYARLAFLVGLAAVLAAEVFHTFSYGDGDAELYFHRGLRLAASPLGELWTSTQGLTDGANLCGRSCKVPPLRS